MLPKKHARFGERGGEDRLEKSRYGVPASTLRNPTPSPEDVEVTRRLAAAGDLLSIEVLDHLIIGQQRFVSMRERGLGFE